MSMINRKAKSDGFYMPSEYSPHSGTVMIWPYRPGSWGKDPKAAQEVFSGIIREISKSEKMYVLARHEDIKTANAAVGDCAVVLEINNDDAWARDTAPTFVINNDGIVRGTAWRFNAWGGEFDGLYASWDNDAKIAEQLCDKIGVDCYDERDFVLEGGSIHSDGEGTILVTEACLLSKGRNPHMSKQEIENRLCECLGAEKVIWLPHGIYNDETNEHVDNVCAFITPGEVVLAWTDNENDPQYKMSKADLEVLERETDAKGRRFIVHKLPIPDNPVLITAEDLNNLEFEAGEDEREQGERLAASYVNFYFTNDAVLLPQFGGLNSESDRRAVEIMKGLCKNRRIVPVYALYIIKGGGNIHCITQQIPKGVNV